MFKIFFWSPGHPAPHPPGPGNRMKILFDMVYTFYLWEHTKFGIKIFEIDFAIEI